MIKMIFVSLIVAVLFSTGSVVASESLFQFQGEKATVINTSKYFANGSQDSTNYEVRAEGVIYGNGEFPSVVIYNSGAGAYTTQSQITFSGFLSTINKIGQDTLTTWIDENNKEKTWGLLNQEAAGYSSVLFGQGTTGFIGETAGGVFVQAMTQGTFYNASISAGAERWITQGYGPTPGSTTDVGTFSEMIGRYSEHYNVRGFYVGTPGKDFKVNYIYSSNPDRPIVTTP